MGRKRDWSIDINYDQDRQWLTWELLYKKMYRQENCKVWSLFDFNKLKTDQCGWYAVTKPANEIQNFDDLEESYKKFILKYSGIFKLSGDADFGMKESTNIELRKLIGNAEGKMHQFYNFSLCPCTGGMNCRKGNSYSDIFPIMLYKISEYYLLSEDKKIEYAQNNLCNKTNSKVYETTDVPSLCAYLDLFENYENYCIQVYFWGKKRDDILLLIQNMTELGKEKFTQNNVSAWDKYCEYAKQYWAIRNQLIIEAYRDN
ncbi:MAG: hypothetical protein ACI4F4_07015 [Lachnospiraceae bacterium]